jgi:3-hydroxyisobutyrate dehydrogenase-like beta-hydroxyacid dehydrogenase
MASTQLATPTLAHAQMPFSRPPTPRAHPLQIGFYGLGSMGYPMARNLASHKSSHPVASPPLLVYNRTISKCEKLVEEVGGENKVRIGQNAAELAIECDVIITNLANDAVVKSVYTEFSNALTVRFACFTGIIISILVSRL